MTAHHHHALPSRRGLLTMGAGVSLAYLGGGAAFGQTANTKKKLVVIICRGAMDDLSVSPPVGDPGYAALRGGLAIKPDTALKLDSTFGLHPALKATYALAQDGQARIAPTVAIPERIRSHFEAQDLLESGGARLYGATTGWLNRTLAALGPTHPMKALSIGPQEPLILRGPIQADSWSPGGRVGASTTRIATTLQELYKADTLLGPALASGLAVEAQADVLSGGTPLKGNDAKAFAETAAKFLIADGGPSIAVLNVDGFDTHANQGAETGLLAGRLALLDQVIDGLHRGMGAAWSDTVVIVATEFGRTARVNGTGGTDHGTASTLILAGGALKPGGMVGDWPTLAEAKLFENRDLAPTLDIRSVFKGVLGDHLEVDRRALDTKVFPDSGAATAVQGLVRA
ncbi:DUF1501 domain-containing protein [soil metagenome]